MKESTRYMTIEEQKLYEELAKEYKIKGYSASVTMIYPSQSILRESSTQKLDRKKK